MNRIPLLSATDIARQSRDLATPSDDLYSFSAAVRKRAQRKRFFRELGWWALVIGAPLLAAWAILPGGR